MKAGQKVRITVDLLMVVLLPLLMMYSLVGEAIHEWMGITMLLLFFFHHVCNWCWYRNLAKGRYSALRIFVTIMDGLLIIIMIALPVSGIIMSRHIFGFLNLPSGMAMARTIHLLASHWGFVLMSLHLGLHWNRIMGMTKKVLHIEQVSPSRKVILRMITILLCCCGIFAFVDLQFGAYLFLQNQFVFFDFSKPLALSLLERAVMLCFFCGIGYYGTKLLQMVQKRKLT